jgi:C4-type Zn-finger protein
MTFECPLCKNNGYKWIKVDDVPVDLSDGTQIEMTMDKCAKCGFVALRLPVEKEKDGS